MILVSATILASAPTATQAASFYWSGNTTVLGGTGTWDTASTFWNASGTTLSGNGTNVAWTGGSDTAIFAGTFTGASTVTLGGNLSAGGLTFAVGNYTIAGGGNLLTLTGASAPLQVVQGQATITAQLADSGGGFNKTGGGLLYLSGNNSALTGNLTLSQGFLQVDTSDFALGTGTLNLNGGELILANSADRTYNNNVVVGANSIIMLDRGTAGAGTTQTLGNLAIGSSTLYVLSNNSATSGTSTLNFGATTITGNANFAVWNRNQPMQVNLGAVTGSGTNSITRTGTGNLTFTSTLDSTVGAFTQYGGIYNNSGFTTFTNAVNSTAPFIVYGGTAILSGNSTALATTDVRLMGGTLQLGVPGDTNVARFNASTDLILGGGRINYAASVASTLTQTINSIVLKPGSSAITAASNPGGTDLLSITSNSVTRDVGSILNFSTGATASYPVQFASPPGLTGNLIGGWATYSTNLWATQGLTGNITGAAFESPDLDAAGPTNNVAQSIVGTKTLSTSPTVNAVRLTGNNSINFLDLSGNTLTLVTGGLMNNGANGDRNYITNGTITAGTSGVGGELFLLTQGAATAQLGIAAVIADNAGGPVHLVYGGDFNSNVFLSGENTYTGTTVLTHSTAATAGNFRIMTERQLGAIPTPGSVVADKLVLNNATLQMLSMYVPVSWAPERGITLGGNGGTIVTNSIQSVIIPAPIAGTGPLNISAGTANTGAGEIVLSGNSTYDGPISMVTGSFTLSFTSIGNINGGPSALGSPSNLANGQVIIGQGTYNPVLQYIGSTPATTDREFVSNAPGNAGATLSASGAYPLTINGNLILAAGAWGGSNTLSGLGIGILNGNILQTDSLNPVRITKTGAGTWRLAGNNTFSGLLSIQGGYIEFTTIGNVGSGPSSLGAPTTTANGTIDFAANSASLRFVGDTSQTSDRILRLAATLNGTNQYVDACGTNGAVLTLTGGIINNQAANTQNFGFGGTGAGIESGVIANGTGTSRTQITKIGYGTWTLNPATSNTYNGTTNVNAGALILDFANMGTPTNVLSATTALTLGGGTLSLVGQSGAANAQTFPSLALTGSTGSQLSLNANGGTSLTLTTTAAAWTRNGGSTLGITTSGTTTITASPALTNGLLPWATLNGIDFATVSGGVIATYASYNGTLPTTGGINADTFTVGGNVQTQTGSVALSALKITPVGSGESLELGAFNLGNGNTNMVAIVFDGSANSYAINGTTGVVGSGGQELIIHTAGANPLTISTRLGNTNGQFSKAGTGTLILSGNNNVSSFTGQTNVQVGALQAGSSTAFSSYGGMSVGPAGTLVLDGYSNQVLALAGSGNITNASATPATLTIQYPAVQGNTTSYASYGTDAAVFSGLLTDGPGGGALTLTKAGQQLLELTNPYYSLTGNATGLASTFTGNVNIVESYLSTYVVTDAGQPGPLGAGTTINLGASEGSKEGILLYRGNNGATNRTINIAAGAMGGIGVWNAYAGGASTLFGATLTLTGNIAGAGGLDKLEIGNLILAGTNTYTGGSAVRFGILQFANPSALPSTGQILVCNGGTVAPGWAMNQTFLNRLDPASVGVVALGANTDQALDFTNYPAVSLGTNNQPQSFVGALTPNNNTYRLGGGGVYSALMIQNPYTLTAANDVVISNAGTPGGTVVLSDIQDYSGNTTLTMTPNMYAWSGFAITNVPARPPVVLVLAGQNAALPNSPNINLGAATTLRLVDSVAAGQKIPGTVNMSGAILEYRNEGSGGNFTQTIGSGNLNLLAGANQIAISPASGTNSTAVLTFPGLSRTLGATVDFNGITGNLATSTAQVLFTTPPTLGAWATWNTTGGFALADANGRVYQAPETVFTGTQDTSGNYTTYSSNITLTGNSSIATLRQTSGTGATFTMTVNSPYSLSVNGLMSQVNNGLLAIAGNGTLTTAGSEMDFFAVSSGGAMTISANVVAPSATLVKSGTSTLALSGSANSYADLVINQASVQINNVGSLPATANITLNGNGSNLSINAAGTYGSSSSVFVNADGFMSFPTGVVTFASPISLAAGTTLTISGGGTNYILSGNISGDGGLIFARGPGAAGNWNVLSGCNTYTGLTQILGANDGSNSGAYCQISLESPVGNAIPGNIILGRRSVNDTRKMVERLRLNNSGNVTGPGLDQIADTSIMTFVGGSGQDAGTFQLYGYNESVGAIQSQVRGDGTIENGRSGLSTLGLVATTGTYDFSGAIRDGSAGTVALLKANGATQILSNANTFSGGIQVAGGSLLINNTNGSGTGTGPVVVYTGSLLGGSGIIGPTGASSVIIGDGAVLAPGANNGTLGGPMIMDLGATTGNVSLAANATMLFALGAPGSSDRLNFYNYGAAGDLGLNDNTVNFTPLIGFGEGTYTLFQFYSDSGVTLTDTNKPSTGLVVGSGLGPTYTALFDYSPTGQINLVVSLVPEPGTLALLAFGSLAIINYRRKRKL